VADKAKFEPLWSREREITRNRRKEKRGLMVIHSANPSSTCWVQFPKC